MTYVKLEDAVKALEEVVFRQDCDHGDANTGGAEEALQALRSLPTDDGWEDKALDKLDAWRFNVMLECQGGNGKCVVGGAELDLNDLLAILDFVSDQRPLPAPPSE